MDSSFWKFDIAQRRETQYCAVMQFLESSGFTIDSAIYVAGCVVDDEPDAILDHLRMRGEALAQFSA